MAKIKILAVLVTLLAVSTWMPISLAAQKPVFGARKEDIPYIKCQVCEKLAKELYQQVQKKQVQISPKKITEYQIIELTENVCNLNKQEADWIKKIDIVEQGDKLQLVEQDVEGQCNSECKTIDRACEEVIGYSDTDIAEYIFTSKPSIHMLVNCLCKDLTDACRKKPPPVPKNRTPGEVFLPKPSKDAEMEKILRSMEGMPGAPNMETYLRKYLMNMNHSDEDDEDDEDQDDQHLLPSKVKSINKKEDVKEKITRGIKSISETLMTHVIKVSNRML